MYMRLQKESQHKFTRWAKSVLTELNVELKSSMTIEEHDIKLKLIILSASDLVCYVQANTKFPGIVEGNGGSFTIISSKRCIMLNISMKVHIIHEAKTFAVQFLESGYLFNSPTRSNTEEK
ncbi:hypothetical protein BDC45DRAFT_539541 [Circinella umbellata]|nr:hypothetical protein BDC45DRAFT_539541 [Circinella umbellata]